jgi:crossover junction endodeoxyribonuclease RusA
MLVPHEGGCNMSADSTMNQAHAEVTQSQDVPIFTLRYDYTRPPLTMNQRIHWRTRAKLTKDIRVATCVLARRIPDLGRCTVALTWYVTDRRVRDADNLVPTLKAMCDGLVDAGVARDDRPEYMHKLMPEIVLIPKETAAHMVLTVRAI